MTEIHFKLAASSPRAELFRASPNADRQRGCIRQEAVDEMLVQHLLTERLIRRIFDKDEFARQNVIAAEVENVIDALADKSFSRKEYLKSLDRFYVAIENAARGLEDFSDKQHLPNTVYERFFQGFSVKAADTHGIMYTPQPIVDFMCASVADAHAPWQAPTTRMARHEPSGTGRVVSRSLN